MGNRSSKDNLCSTCNGIISETVNHHSHQCTSSQTEAQDENSDNANVENTETAQTDDKFRVKTQRLTVITREVPL